MSQKPKTFFWVPLAQYFQTATFAFPFGNDGFLPRCGRGGTGRRAGLRSQWALPPVEVRFFSSAHLVPGTSVSGIFALSAFCAFLYLVSKLQQHSLLGADLSYDAFKFSNCMRY